MNNISVRLLAILGFFISLLALAAVGIYFLYNSVVTKAKPLLERVESLVPLPEPEYNYNFPIGKVAGVNQTVNYEYELFNIPADYTVYAHVQPYSSERYTNSYNTQAAFSEVETFELPVLAKKLPVEVAKAAAGPLTVPKQQNLLRLIPAGEQVYLTCSSCLEVKQLQLGDVILLRGQDRLYAFKVISGPASYPAELGLPDEARQTSALLVVQADMVVFTPLRAIP